MDQADDRGTLVTIALALIFGVLAALARVLMILRRRNRHQAAAQTRPVTVYQPERAGPVLPAHPAPTVYGRPADVAADTVRLVRVRTARNLRAAFAEAHRADTAPVDPLTGPVANWAAFTGQESPLAAVTARAMHARGEHTGMTSGVATWRKALLQAGISPDGPMEKLDLDDTGAAA